MDIHYRLCFTFYPTRACAVYKKLVNKSFAFMHCWLKLNGQPKWNIFIAKVVAQVNEDEIGDHADPTHETRKRVRRNLGKKKWEEESANREGAAARLKERFEDILAKKEEVKEICPRCNNKVVIYISLYHDKCFLFMLDLY